ncbi:MAG: hypothetical protein RSA17_00005 [Ruthenibacterium sp.]
MRFVIFFDTVIAAGCNVELYHAPQTIQTDIPEPVLAEKKNAAHREKRADLLQILRQSGFKGKSTQRILDLTEAFAHGLLCVPPLIGAFVRNAISCCTGASSMTGT